MPSVSRSRRSPAVLPSLRDRLPLGREGLEVSPVCLGMVCEPHVVTEAFLRGVNFFFVSADMHWPMYEQTRRGLADLFRDHPSARDAVVVASVSYVAQTEFAVAPFLEVIAAVPGLCRLDVTIVGGAKRQDLARLETFGLHRTSRKVPDVRATGVTFHDRRAAAEWLAREELDVAFVRYNANHCGAERDLFPSVGEDARPLVFNFKSTAGHVPAHRVAALGLDVTAWQPDISDQYRFVLGRHELDGVLCAPRTMVELDALTRALEAGPLTGDEAAYLRDLAALDRGRGGTPRAPSSRAARDDYARHGSREILD